MKRLISSALLVSFTTIHPMNASEILSSMGSSQNPTQFMENALCSSGTFDVDEARRFLFQLKRDVKSQYGIDVDLQTVITEALKVIKATDRFTVEELDTIEGFYSRLIEPQVRVAYKGKPKKHKSPEFFLPAQMAMGFVCILSGSLLCILPFGVTQGVGGSLIAGGIYAVIDGARNGERPYYTDSETGQPLPLSNQGSSPSIGVGTGF